MPIPLRLALALLGLVLLGGCRRAAPVSTVATPALNVRLAPIEQSNASPAIRVAGVLARQTEADLSFPVAGLVESVRVRAGDHVRKDQELARLQLDQPEAQLTQATATLEKARRDLMRVEKLQAERVATLENLQDARTAVDQAEAALRIAEFNRRHAVISAPADGTILRRLAEPSELVAGGRAIISFASDGDGWIAKAGLAARDANRVSPGAAAALDNGAGTTVTGRLLRLAEAADPATRTVPVEIVLDAPPPGARSGLVVSLTLTPRPVAPRTAIPLAALREGMGGRATVFVVAAGASTAQRVAVELEQLDGERAYLKTSLPAGASVVVAGGEYLSDGAAVNVTK